MEMDLMGAADVIVFNEMAWVAWALTWKWI